MCCLHRAHVHLEMWPQLRMLGFVWSPGLDSPVELSLACFPQVVDGSIGLCSACPVRFVCSRVLAVPSHGGSWTALRLVQPDPPVSHRGSVNRTSLSHALGEVGANVRYARNAQRCVQLSSVFPTKGMFESTALPALPHHLGSFAQVSF